MGDGGLELAGAEIWATFNTLRDDTATSSFAFGWRGVGGRAAWRRCAGPQAGGPGQAAQSLQEQLDLTRKQRMELEARLERELAAEIAQRAQMLAMGGEMGALQRLEQLLDSAQAPALGGSRDRIRLLDDAARTPGASILVVLLRMEQVPQGEVGTALLIDGASVARTPSAPSKRRRWPRALPRSWYRGEVPPSAHKVMLQLAAKGINTGTSIEVPAAPKQITYVEFTLRGGALVVSTWTSSSGP